MQAQHMYAAMHGTRVGGGCGPCMQCTGTWYIYMDMVRYRMHRRHLSPLSPPLTFTSLQYISDTINNTDDMTKNEYNMVSNDILNVKLSPSHHLPVVLTVEP